MEQNVGSNMSEQNAPNPQPAATTSRNFGGTMQVPMTGHQPQGVQLHAPATGYAGRVNMPAAPAQVAPAQGHPQQVHNAPLYPAAPAMGPHFHGQQQFIATTMHFSPFNAAPYPPQHPSQYNGAFAVPSRPAYGFPVNGNQHVPVYPPFPAGHVAHPPAPVHVTHGYYSSYGAPPRNGTPRPQSQYQSPPPYEHSPYKPSPSKSSEGSEETPRNDSGNEEASQQRPVPQSPLVAGPKRSFQQTQQDAPSAMAHQAAATPLPVPHVGPPTHQSPAPVQHRRVALPPVTRPLNMSPQEWMQFGASIQQGLDRTYQREPETDEQKEALRKKIQAELENAQEWEKYKRERLGYPPKEQVKTVSLAELELKGRKVQEKIVLMREANGALNWYRKASFPDMAAIEAEEERAAKRRKATEEQ